MKKNLFILFGFLLVSVFSISPSSLPFWDHATSIAEAATECTYSISQNEQFFEASGGPGSLSVTTPSGCRWTAKSNVGWIKITGGKSGKESRKVTYSVSKNKGPSPRIGTLTIAGQTFTLTQDQGLGSTSSISPAGRSFAASEGTGSVTVTASTGTSWTAKSNAAWISVVSGAGGKGKGTLTFSVSANAGSSQRAGTLTVAGQTFTVTQEGAGGSCTYSLSPKSQALTATGGWGTVYVTAPSGCPWTATSNASWISVYSGSRSGTGSGPVLYYVYPQAGASRTGTITIADQTFSIHAADLQVSDVPTFQLRARVASVKGAAPGVQQAFEFGFTDSAWKWITPTAKFTATNWSEWVTFGSTQIEKTLKCYPNNYYKLFPVVTRFRMLGVADPTIVEAEVRINETGKVIPLRWEAFNTHYVTDTILSLLVSRDEKGVPYAATEATYNQRYWKELANINIPPEKRPKYISLIDRYIGGDYDRTAWRDGFAALSRIGINTVGMPPNSGLKNYLDEFGFSGITWGDFILNGATHDFVTPSNPDVRAWARSKAAQYLDAGFRGDQVKHFVIYDEPAWEYPDRLESLKNSPVALQRFRTYLSQQGLTPADLGAADWNSVLPVGLSQATHLPGKRLFYWTMRFFPWDSSRMFSEVTDQMQDSLWQGIQTTTNWNNFHGRLFQPYTYSEPKSPDSAWGDHDWFEFGRMKGGSTLWTEDWFGDDLAYRWSFYASKLLSAARKNDLSFGGYVVGYPPQNREDGFLQKVLALVGNGAKTIYYYIFGPEYNFPGNGYSEMPGRLAKIAQANSTIGSAEDLLWPGKRPKAEVAILHPRSAQLWDTKSVPMPVPITDIANTGLEYGVPDYMWEVYALYTALQHANIPVDFVEEDDLSASGLSGYNVLYVTTPNLPEEGAQGIADWVRAGGTLVTVPNAGMWDRYNEPSATLSSFTGTQETSRERVIFDYALSKPYVARGNGTQGTFQARAIKTTLSNIPADASVIATFDDGAPAVTLRQLTLGRHLHFAWMPGLSYVQYHGKPGTLPTGWPEDTRNWITYPTRLAQVVPPVAVNKPMIETPMLLSDKGAAITLLNWTNDPQTITLDIRVPFSVTSIESVKKGSVAFQNTATGATVTMELGGADILMVRPNAPPPSCTYSLSSASATSTAAGGSGSVSVTTQSGCGWTAASNASWITITSGASGSGSGTVGYLVAANTNTSQRIGTLTIASQTFTVTQDGLGCAYSISPTTKSFTAAAGTGSVSVTAGGGCNWNAICAGGCSTWITITSGANGSGNGTVNYSVAANTSASPRTGTLTIADKSFTITQEAQGCTYSISPTTKSFTAAAGTGSVSLTAGNGCNWTATCTGGCSTWITITSGANGSGNGTVTYSVAANTSTSSRSGSLAIAEQTFTVSQEAAGCVSSLYPTSRSFGSNSSGGYVVVNAPTGCNWTATSNAGWLTITYGSAGTGYGAVYYSISQNTGPSRTGILTIGGLTFTATQEGSGGSCTYSISPTSQTFTASGGSDSVSVSTSNGCPWTATSSVSWVSITSGGSGSGSGTIYYSVSQNTATSSRTGTLTIMGQTFTITQQGQSCTYFIAPASQNFSAAAGTGSVNVTTQTGCPWTAASNVTWLTITSGASGSGSGTVYYSVGANTGASRTGTITIPNQTFTVTQEAGGGICTYSISPVNQTIPASGATGYASVTAPSGCNWNATSNVSWVSITSGSSGSGSGTVYYSVTANTATASRTGTITIADRTFTVTQAGGSGTCSFTISPTSQTLSAAAGTGTVSVTTQSGCPWTAVSNASWITITSGSSGSGSGMVYYSVNANTGTSSRTGTVTIAEKTFTVTQNGGGGNSCTVSLSYPGIMFSASGGTYFVSVDASADCSWTATSNASWISVTSGASGTGSGDVYYSIAPNTGSFRNGTITIGDQTFTLSQYGK